jgi:cytochrome P450
MTTIDTAESEYDPFEDFDRSVGIGVDDDPYPRFAEMRAGSPLSEEDVRAKAGLPDGPEGDAAAAALPRRFSAYSLDAVKRVFSDNETFSSEDAYTVGPVLGRTILEMDEPEHRSHRALVQQAFSRRVMEQWETDIVPPIVDGYIDRFVDRGSAELMHELTFPFPVDVVARLIGLPSSDVPRFHRWAVELISFRFDPERGLAASASLWEYLAGILAERRTAPTDDFLSVLAHVEHDGERLTDDEIISFLRLLLPAGAETTYRGSSNTLFGLLTHPDQLDAVRADPALFPQTIEEALRWEAPLQFIRRRATIDTEVEGVAVPAGSIVACYMGSANHDEKHWEDPDAFDVFRTPRPHLAFATGPHMCLGMHLARMETRVALARLFARLPNLRLDDSVAPKPKMSGDLMRSPSSLPVLFG